VTRYFLRALARHLRRGKALFLLSFFGVALGVGAVLSIQIINANALAAFSGSMKAVSGEADCLVLGRTPAFDETLFAKVMGQPGVAAAWPLYRVEVALSGREESYLEVMGVDVFAPVRFPVQESLAGAVPAPPRCTGRPAIPSRCRADRATPCFGSAP
jgi:putative ABC transport system permease protein